MDNESLKKEDGAVNALPRPLILVATVVGALYLTEVIIMSFFHEFAETAYYTMDALILTTVLLPLLYFFIYRPFSRSVTDLKALSGALERRVRERTVQLEFSEALHRAVIASSADAIIRINSDGAILSANPAAHYMFGYGKTELENKHISLLLPDGYERVLVDGFAASLDGWDGHSAAPVAEAVAVTKSGKKLMVECASSECLVNSEISFVIDMRDVSERRKAEKELISIMEAQPDILYVINTKGALIKWNSALQELCGLTREQMMERPAADFVCEEDRQVVFDGIKEVLEKGLASIEVRFIRHDGALVPHLCNGAAWKSPDGELLGFIGVGKDITERKKAEETLREGEERFRQLSEAGFEGIVINVEGKVVDCNSAFARMFGYAPEEIIGTIPVDLSPPESQAVIMDHIRRGSEEVYDVMGRKKDGTLFPIEMQGRVILYRGQKARITAVRDISERVKSEQAIRESEERFRQLSEASFEGVTITVGGKIVDCNTSFARKFGYARDEIIGKTPLDLVPPESYAIVADHIGRGSEECYEAVGLKKDGTLFPIEIQGRGAVYHGQKARVTSIRDITERIKAEQAIRESEERLRVTFDNAAFGLAFLNLDGKFTRVNDALCLMFGYAEKEVIGKSFQDFTHTLDMEMGEKFLRKVARGEAVKREVEKRFMHRDGHVIWCSVAVALIKDANGRPMHLYVQVIDITARKEAEKTYAELFNVISDGLVLHEFDPVTKKMGTFVDVNDAMCKRLGYFRAEMLTIGPDDIDTGETVTKPEEYGWLERENLEHGSVRFERVHRAKDGRLIPVEIISRQFPLGEKTMALSVVRDITERKRAEDNLRASERKFRAVAQSAADAIISINGAGEIIHWNKGAEKMFGHAESEALGKPVGLLIPKRYDEAHRRGLARATAGGPYRLIGKTATLEGLRKDGAEFPLELSLAAWEEGGKTYFTGIIRDITERKAAEEKLKAAKEAAEEATKLKDKFVSLVSHDLKTPLASMIGFLHLVRDDYAEPLNEGAKLILDRAAESGEAMVRLIDDLLTISRFKTGQLKLNRQFFDAQYLGVIMAGNYAHLARQKGIEIESTIPANSRVYGDKTLLAEAVQNLVTNAIKFCKNGDRISISLAEENASTICVRDTGPGIPPNLLADLFKFEKKTSTPGTAGETGTGFGLPLVKNIMELHGGGVGVISEPGKGCLFCLTLPYVRPKILLVDDDGHARLLQTLQLREMKADIIEAENGEDALNKMAGVRPDLVITDIQMPVMDGLELLKRIKGAPETKDIPVIVMIGEYGMEIRDSIFKFGGDDFVTKKIDKAEFLPRVRRFIG
ncbi:MAG: PAS domain S-box protein [Nitrospinae bacterium]|nr:PAS domain S-box protein [Nitrospinota bacterium]